MGKAKKTNLEPKGIEDHEPGGTRKQFLTDLKKVVQYKPRKETTVHTEPPVPA
jgi:hypothetical protein